MPRPHPVLAVSFWLLALLVVPRPAAAYHEATIHLEPRLWFPALSAEVRSSRGGLSGDVLTDSDLAIDDPVVPGAAVTVRLGPHSLRLEGLSVSADGDTQVDRTFNFAGRTYTVNTRVTSEFDALIVALDYGYDLFRTEPLAVTATLGARLVDAEARLTAPELGFAGEASFQGVVPAVGVLLVAHPVQIPPLSSLAVTLRVSGLTIGERGSYFDVDGAVEWLPLPTLALRAGYRFIHGRGEEGGDRAEFDLSGPYVGLTFAF